MSEPDDRFCDHGEPLGTRCRRCENPEPPGPPDLSLRKVFDLITPPGTDGGKLLDALKSARRGPVPPRKPPNGAGEDDHDWLAAEMEQSGREYRALPESARPVTVPPAERDHPSLPEDPFTPGKMAAAAVADWYRDLLETDIPLASVERIIGYMMAGAAAFTAGGFPEGER